MLTTVSLAEALRSARRLRSQATALHDRTAVLLKEIRASQHESRRLWLRMRNVDVRSLMVSTPPAASACRDDALNGSWQVWIRQLRARTQRARSRHDLSIEQFARRAHVGVQAVHKLETGSGGLLTMRVLLAIDRCADRLLPAERHRQARVDPIRLLAVPVQRPASDDTAELRAIWESVAPDDRAALAALVAAACKPPPRD